MKPLESCISVLLDIKNKLESDEMGYGLAYEEEELILDLIKDLFEIEEISEIVDMFTEGPEE